MPIITTCSQPKLNVVKGTYRKLKIRQGPPLKFLKPALWDRDEYGKSIEQIVVRNLVVRMNEIDTCQCTSMTLRIKRVCGKL